MPIPMPKSLVQPTKLRSPLKWHGGKSYLARRIIALFPPHRAYCEPFAGGLSILLNKTRAEREVVGDIDGKLVLFWSVMASRDWFWPFRDFIAAQEYKQEIFDHAKIAIDHAPERPWELEAIARWKFAAYYLIRNRMSRGGLGKDFAWSERLRGGQPGDLNAWKTIVPLLHEAHLRLSDERHTKIVHGPAIDLIRANDGPDTLFYCDPSYLPETRTTRKAYQYEMTFDDHVQLLDCLVRCKGKVFLSGYMSDLYSKTLKEWKLHTFDMPNHSGQGKTKNRRIECLWENI